MTIVSQTQLENASLDCDTLKNVINGSEVLNGTGIVTSREGTALQTIKKIIKMLSELDVGEAAAVQINTRMDALEARIEALES